MNNCDYEIVGYTVKWEIDGRKYCKGGFLTEEAAVDFAKKKQKMADSVALLQERAALGWWK